MPVTFRFDYPPEVVQARDKVYERVRELLAEQSLEAVRQARHLHFEWLDKYPDDYIALDAGEVLAMAEDAYRRTERLPAMATPSAMDAEVPVA